MLQAHEVYLEMVRESADQLKGHLARLNASLEKDLARRKELLKYAKEEGISHEEIRKEEEEFKFLESIYPVQLYRQLAKWIKHQEKIKDGPPKQKRKRKRRRPS